MPNVKVKFEREGANPITVTTGGDGIAFFSNVLGGDGFVSIYFGDGDPVETGAVYVENSVSATFTLGRYVTIFGMIIEASQLGVSIILIVLLALFAFFLLYRRRKAKAPPEESTEKKS